MMLAQIEPGETDKGPKSSGLGTERLCLVTREVKPIADMIRFVVGPDGEVLADLKRKLPGRGVWITATRKAVAEAVKRNVFRRGFRQDVKVPADFVERLEDRLRRHALDALSIAHKAGRVVQGFAKVEAAMTAGPGVAVIHAAEAASDGMRKLAQAGARARATRRDPENEAFAEIRGFTSAQLDLALGRSNVVHAALLAGPASDTFLARWHLLDRFRMNHPDGGDTALGSRTNRQ
jgi:predicted RNA-binding protein YlxR (DUF448 family)